jgi:hypothetical protein
LARFYGFSHVEIDEMPSDVFYSYYGAIDAIKAGEVLISLKVADFPNQDKEERRKIHEGFFKRANPKELRNEKPLTTKQLVERMQRIGV